MMLLAPSRPRALLVPALILALVIVLLWPAPSSSGAGAAGESAEAGANHRHARAARVCSRPVRTHRKLLTRKLQRKIRAASRRGHRAHRKRARLRRAVRKTRRCQKRTAARKRAARRLRRSIGPEATSAGWRPYGPASPWNRRVRRGAPLDPRSPQVVRRLLSWGGAQNLLAGHSGTGADYYHPIYLSNSSDPVFELDATQPWGTSEIEGHRIHIPDAARPAAGGDGHLSVITEDGWEYDLWTVESKPRGGGRLRFGWGGRTRIDGDGLGSNATAAHFGLAAGVIRAPELETGRIDHALFMGVHCTAPKDDAVYPAAPNTGEPCSRSGESDQFAPPMGARFVLDMSDAEIAALRVPGWKKTILRALATYGMIVGDAIGGAAWGLQFESGSTYTSFGRPDPLAAFARRAGLGRWNGMYVFNLQDGVDWSRLRLVAPCVSAGRC
jgi:hypothetical protein